MKVGIIGGGNFGTAIANIVGGNGHPTALWMRDPAQVADTLAHGENRRYLPGFPLAEAIAVTGDLREAVADRELLFVSVPSAAFRGVSAQVAPLLAPDAGLVSLTKGIEGESFKLMSDLLREAAPGHSVGALSGPNLAKEIAQGQFAGTVIASHSGVLCQQVQQALKSPTLRVYANSDLYGVELGGALKNIYAIICGVASALQVGQNTIGMLITRALAEMGRLSVSLGASPLTFLGLAGVGDLMVTCTSPLSRNYQLGEKLGQGMSLAEAVESLGKLAEGVNTLKVVRAQSQKLGVYMPLVEGLHQIVFEERDLAQVVAGLMTGAEGEDVEFIAPAQWPAAR
ncbi:MAG: NAD(P)H-dependent glycerol-3-phosphate dehydrogenase [Pseudomonadota bacterium]